VKVYPVNGDVRTKCSIYFKFYWFY